MNPRHGDRQVVRSTVDGQTRIRKQYRTGAEHVYAAMVALWASPMGSARGCPAIPEPLALDAAHGAIDMGAIEGIPLSDGSLGMLPDALDDVALLLADLHRCGVRVDRQRTPRKVMRRVAERLQERDRFLVELLERRGPVNESLCLSHGDFSPCNVLSTEQGLVLIDLDRLQMAGAGRDVNHLGAWCWATIALGRDGSGCDAWDLCDEFEAAYLAFRPEAAPDLVAGRAFHRATGLLRIATEWSAITSHPATQRLVIDEARRIATSAG
jgi:aminoglycoside phosphotransferase